MTSWLEGFLGLEALLNIWYVSSPTLEDRLLEFSFSLISSVASTGCFFGGRPRLFLLMVFEFSEMVTDYSFFFLD